MQPWLKAPKIVCSRDSKNIIRRSLPHTFCGRRYEICRWWNTLDHLPNVPEKYEDQVAQYRELFLDACRIRMRSDVPIGTALSGGLDFSSVSLQ